jgi:hypothetical protein
MIGLLHNRPSVCFQEATAPIPKPFSCSGKFHRLGFGGLIL